MKKLFAVLAALFLLALMACSGGGSSAGLSSPGNNNSDGGGSVNTVSDYYPLTSGSTWEYRYNYPGGTSDTEGRTIISNNGEIAVMEFAEDNGNVNAKTRIYFTTYDSAISMSKTENIYEDSSLHQASVSTYSPPLLIFVTSLDIGHTDTRTSNQITSVTSSNNGQTSTSNQTATLTTSYKILGFETVTVPAGTFNNALKLEGTVTTDGQSVISTIWCAKGIGEVKGVHNTSDGEMVMELINYKIE